MGDDKLAAELAAISKRDIGIWAERGDASERLQMLIVAAANDVPRLLALAEAVDALTRNTDGDYLHPDSELPVGEFQAAVSRALLGEGGDRHA